MCGDFARVSAEYAFFMKSSSIFSFVLSTMMRTMSACIADQMQKKYDESSVADPDPVLC
jgi:hypothetical protein